MIRLVEDVGAPALVFAADWGADYADSKSAATAFKWNRPMGIGLAAIGYIAGGWLGYGGQFVKNLGIASFDWGANAIKGYIQEAGGVSARPVSQRVAVRQRVGSYPAQPKNTKELWPTAV